MLRDNLAIPYSRTKKRIRPSLRLLFIGCLAITRMMSATECLVKRAYVDPGAGRVHILYTTLKDVEISPEKDQVAADPPVIGPDHEIVGWTVQVPNCCTSYPIPVALVLLKCGRVIQHIADGLMVYKWSFLRNGQEVAVSSGTVHGMQGIHLSLYNALTGKLLKTWDGDETDTPPRWGLSVAH
jgi:hypothetical protein